MDFKKYKRFFAFGCSMTSYAWPTWADIISKEIPQSYNFGQAGGGNLFISCQVTEACLRYKFTEDDLVIIMWSGVSREDRYVNGNWLTAGNIYTQNYYDDDFVKKYADDFGYLLRDINLITLTKKMLENNSSNFLMLSMAPLDYTPTNRLYKDKYTHLLELYKDTIKDILPDLLTLGLQGEWPQHPIVNEGHQTADYHPSPKQHFTYLQKLFPEYQWNRETLEFVDNEEYKMQQYRTWADLKFPYPNFRL